MKHIEGIYDPFSGILPSTCESFLRHFLCTKQPPFRHCVGSAVAIRCFRVISVPTSSADNENATWMSIQLSRDDYFDQPTLLL